MGACLRFGRAVCRWQRGLNSACGSQCDPPYNLPYASNHTHTSTQLRLAAACGHGSVGAGRSPEAARAGGHDPRLRRLLERGERLLQPGHQHIGCVGWRRREVGVPKRLAGVNARVAQGRLPCLSCAAIPLLHYTLAPSPPLDSTDIGNDCVTSVPLLLATPSRLI